MNPVEFAKVAFNWEAFDYQEQPLSNLEKEKRIIMACGRQVGKTEMCSIMALWYSIMNPKKTVLIISPTQRQSNNLFRRMKGFLTESARKNPQLRLNDTIIRETQTELNFDNDSNIFSLPCSNKGDNLRGYVADLVIIDEGGYVDDELFAVIRPMLITTGGRLVIVGTPNGCNNMFFKFYHEGKYKFRKYKFTTEMNPMANKKEMEIDRESMSEIEWRQEYLGEFIDTADLLFRPADVSKCMQKDNYRAMPEPIYEYYLGYDPATVGQDEAAACILEYRPKFNEAVNTVPYSIAQFKTWKGKKIPEQLKIIEQLHKEWKFKKMMVDTTGMGQGLVSDNVNILPLNEFQFTIKTKQDIFFNLKRLIEAEQIILGKNEKLKKQLVELKGERKGDGMTRITHPKYGHDDLATSLALAVWAAKGGSAPIFFAKARGILH